MMLIRNCIYFISICICLFSVVSLIYSIVNKNAMSDLEKETAVRKKLLDTIESCVEAAVGSNMQLADSMKEDGNSLTEEQIAKLNKNVKTLVYSSLPSSLTEEDGTLMKIIGGPDKLEALIDAMMEKYVYEYKIKKSAAVQVIQAEEVVTRAPKSVTARRLTVKRITEEDK